MSLLPILAALQPYAELISYLGWTCLGLSVSIRGYRVANEMLDNAKEGADEIMRIAEKHATFVNENVDELANHQLALKLLCVDLAERDPRWKSWDHVLSFYVQKARVYRREQAADSISSPPSE